MLRIAIFYCLLFFFLHSIVGQKPAAEFLKIDKITIKGYNKTKLKTIQRELDFKVGDSILIAALPQRFQRNTQMLINSTLFSSAEFSVGKVDSLNHSGEIVVELVERWYLNPFGWLSVADRNFNVWFFEKNRDLRRLNFQVGLNWNNFLGHRDLLRLSTDFGFGTKYEINYSIPGVNKRKTIGFYFNALYSSNKEVWYTTRRDSLQFYRDDEKPQIYRTRFKGGFTYRPWYRTTYSFHMSYFQNRVDDIISKDLNPDFFLNARSTQEYFSLNFRVLKDLRDSRYYPRKGSFFALNIQKDGVFSRKEDVQALFVVFQVAKYIELYKDRIDYEGVIKTRFELTQKAQPYFNNRALGYGNDYLRGYEYYVIDGPNFGFLKNSVRFDIWQKNIDFGDFVPASFRKLPTHIWLCLNSDFGWVQNARINTENTFPGRLLWGKGVGVNFLFYNANFIQFEISQNHLKKWGWYLHYVVPLD
ncbi:MAG: BamA/TamA family outer membrane protein [Saprospiraceae bacterium]